MFPNRLVSLLSSLTPGREKAYRDLLVIILINCLPIIKNRISVFFLNLLLQSASETSIHYNCSNDGWVVAVVQWVFLHNQEKDPSGYKMVRCAHKWEADVKTSDQFYGLVKEGWQPRQMQKGRWWCPGGSKKEAGIGGSSFNIYRILKPSTKYVF